MQCSRLFVESDGLSIPFCKLRGQKFKLLLKFRFCQVIIRAATVVLASLRVLGRRHYEMILAFRRSDETKHRRNEAITGTVPYRDVGLG